MEIKQITEIKKFWQCPICKIKYSNYKDAERCSKKPIEKKVFKIGDKVRVTFIRHCSKKEKNYSPIGKVVSIKGPKEADAEYELKWLGGKRERINSHVFLYEIDFTCPHCREKTGGLCYAPELKLIRSRR